MTTFTDPSFFTQFYYSQHSLFREQTDIKQFCSRNRTMAFLKIAPTSTDPEFIELYRQQIEAHNLSMITDQFPNSGFDLFIPTTETFAMPNATKMINLQVKTEMSTYKYSEADDYEVSAAYYVFPRSSISKTELMLSNHTGIIDSGYRGNLIGAFRWLKPELGHRVYTVPKHTRLLQICHPSLCPIIVQMVSESELTNTERGEGGFGSTGATGVGI